MANGGCLGVLSLSHGCSLRSRSSEIGTFLLRNDSTFSDVLPTTDSNTGAQTNKALLTQDASSSNGSPSCTGYLLLFATTLFASIASNFLTLYFYRYIPVGLLEQPPQRINEKPPSFIGRNDLETLMASRNSEDWVKIRSVLPTYMAPMRIKC